MVGFDEELGGEDKFLIDENYSYEFNDATRSIVKKLEPICKTSEYIGEMISRTLEAYRCAVQPIFKCIDLARKEITAMARMAEEALKPIAVARKLGNHQYIQWEHMTKEYIDDIYDSKNVDKTLRMMYEHENYRSFYLVAEKCMGSDCVGKNSRIIRQAVNSFANRDYDLAAIGITVVIDGALSKITGNATTNIRVRVEQLLQQLNDDEELTSEEYALIMLYISLEEALKTFAASSDFSNKEPSYINRHWTLHGRNTRRKTKMDCVKLIRFLYAAIIIKEYENK